MEQKIYLKIMETKAQESFLVILKDYRATIKKTFESENKANELDDFFNMSLQEVQTLVEDYHSKLSQSENI